MQKFPNCKKHIIFFYWKNCHKNNSEIDQLIIEPVQCCLDLTSKRKCCHWPSSSNPTTSIPSLSKVLRLMVLSELMSNWTTSLCPLIQASINALRPIKSVVFSSIFLSEQFKSNLTTSVGPLLQAKINALRPSLSLVLRSIFLSKQFKSNWTIFLCPL